MADLTAKTRNALPASKFALPAERKYPVQDAAHARNALARASQQLSRGNLTEAQHAMIVRKADAKLSGKSAAQSATTPGKR